MTLSKNPSQTNVPSKSEDTTFVATKVVSSQTLKFVFLVCLLSTFYFPLSTFALTSVSTSNANVVKNGLVGWWTFDGKNMTNATATDMSGNGNNGTLINMTQASAKTIGKVGQALNFKGSNSNRIQIPNSSSIRFNAGSSATFSAWVYVTATSNQGGAYQSIFEKGGGSDAAYQVYIAATTGYLNFYSDNGGVISSNVAVPINKWNHITVVVTGGVIYFYINGVLVASPSGNFKTEAGTASLYLGDWGNNTPGNALLGSIDDARIYNRALSAQEVQSLYKAGGGVLQLSAPKSGLVGYWTFDNANMTNATATDISGYGNNGALTNMTATSSSVTGKLGQALAFSGALGTKVQVISNSSLNITNTVTQSAWIYATSSPACGNYSALVSKGTQGSAEMNYQMGIFNNCTSNNIFFYYYNGGVQDIRGGTPIALNKWYHLVTVYNDTTNTIDLYVNGVLESKTVLTGSPESGSILTNNQRLSLGVQDTAGNRPFNGYIDDVRIYNRALNAAEVTALYKVGRDVAVSAKPAVSPSNSVGINSGLVGYWTFDGKNMTNATATDISGNGYNGTLTNMTQASAKTIGKMGQALKFDGVDDSLDVSTFTSTSKTYSFAFWVKRGSSAANISYVFDSQIGRFVIDFGLYAITNNILNFYDGSWKSIPGVVSINKWHHIVLTLNNSSLIATEYMDGSYVGTTTYAGNIDIGVGGLTSIGNYYSGGNGAPFDGSLDDFRIYNRVLTASEVYKLYKLGTQ